MNHGKEKSPLPIAVRFDSEDPFFRDHFPSCPVIPGSFILEAFLDAIRETLGKASFRTLKKIRFYSFAPPGQYGISLLQEKDELHAQMVKEGKLFAKAVFLR